MNGSTAVPEIECPRDKVQLVKPTSLSNNVSTLIYVVAYSFSLSYSARRPERQFARQSKNGRTLDSLPS